MKKLNFTVSEREGSVSASVVRGHFSVAGLVAYGSQAALLRTSFATSISESASSLPLSTQAPRIHTSAARFQSQPSDRTEDNFQLLQHDLLEGVLHGGLDDVQHTPIDEAETWTQSCLRWLDEATSDLSNTFRKVFGFTSSHRSSCHHFDKIKSAPGISTGYKEYLAGEIGQDKVQSIKNFWNSGKSEPEKWSDLEKSSREIPQYVVDHAPLVHLFDKEQFWPCDIAEHLTHTTPYLNFTAIEPENQHPNLTNLDRLNEWGRAVFLHSNDDVSDHPDWLVGQKNIPIKPDSCNKASSTNCGGRSDAPAILVVVNKPDGIVDAFWFFFYSYNLGNKVFKRFGNHVGDWEHTLVRFQHGKPKEIYFSEHSWGNAYTYQAVEKIGIRPVAYSAVGTHAMYAKAGVHRYVLPWGLLTDETSRGPLWDPLLNSHAYTYDPASDTVRASNFTPKSPTEWFHFAGRWGDKRYPLSDPRQYYLFGNYHYVSGPTGPRFKNLRRKNVCQGQQTCTIKNWIGLEDGVTWIDENDMVMDDNEDDFEDKLDFSTIADDEL